MPMTRSVRPGHVEKPESIRTLTDQPWGQEPSAEILGSHRIRGPPIFVASGVDDRRLLGQQTPLKEALATFCIQNGVSTKRLLLKEPQVVGEQPVLDSYRVWEYCRDTDRSSTGARQLDRGFQKIFVEEGGSESFFQPDLLLSSQAE